MAIKVECKHCQASFQASPQHAGKTTRCPGCDQPLKIPAANGAAVAKTAAKKPAAAAPTGTAPTGKAPTKQQQSPPKKQLTREQITKQLLGGFQGSIRRTRPTITYRLAALVVAIVMVLLPIIYIALIALTGYGVYYHAINHVTMVTETTVRGRGVIFVVLAYAAPIVCGAILVVFMIKPLFARAADDTRTRSLRRESEPLLFEFVDRICEIVGASRPKRIDLDCQVNASASFRRGMLSMLGSDLVLTIGLPLVAGLNARQFAGVLAHEFGHFAQGAGMRLTFIIRSISHWLMRVVYQRDVADEWLANAAASVDIRIGWIFYLAMLFVWLSRRVLWCLMMIGHLVGSYMLRQMEFDADRYETRLAGTDAFRQTVHQLQLLGISNNKAFSDLREFYREGRLGDNLPKLITANAKQMPAKLKQEIEKSIAESETGWFDTHPSDRDRIANSEREDTDGIFQVELPASALFADFEAQSKATTWEFYRGEFGNKLERERLRPVEEMLAKQQESQAAQAATERYFQGEWNVTLPLRISASWLCKPDNPQAALQALKSTRQQMLEQIATVKPHFASLRDSLDELSTVEQLRLITRAGLKIAIGDKRYDGKGEGDFKRMASAAEKRVNLASRAVEDYQQLAADRLRHALQLMYVAKIAERLPKAKQWHHDADRKLECLVALGDAIPAILPAARLYSAGTVLIEQLSNDADESIIIALQGVGDKLLPIAKQYYTAWSRIAYPYSHANKQMTLAGYLVPTVPSKDDYGSIFGATEQLVEGVFPLYTRLLGDFLFRAEAVEQVIGLPKLPDPSPDESATSSD